MTYKYYELKISLVHSKQTLKKSLCLLVTIWTENNKIFLMCESLRSGSKTFTHTIILGNVIIIVIPVSRKSG
jgi:hypothetical protein